MRKTSNFTITISKELGVWLRAYKEKYCVSVSAIVHKLLKEWITNQAEGKNFSDGETFCLNVQKGKIGENTNELKTKQKNF